MEYGMMLIEQNKRFYLKLETCWQHSAICFSWKNNPDVPRVKLFKIIKHFKRIKGAMG